MSSILEPVGGDLALIAAHSNDVVGIAVQAGAARRCRLVGMSRAVLAQLREAPRVLDESQVMDGFR